jgi:tetratricopeptide (TPR) repeat protein
MNHPSFTDLRRQIDAAITFHDLEAVHRCIGEGLWLAQTKECPGEAMYFHAQEAIVSERFDEAVSLLEQALVFNPLDGAAYNDIALCMVEMGRIEGVLDVFDKGIAVEGDYATIHHNKGWLLNKLGHQTAALACFERAIALEPRRVVTWENMADVYEEQGRIPAAISAYRKALECLDVPGNEIREQIMAEIQRLESREKD